MVGKKQQHNGFIVCGSFKVYLFAAAKLEHQFHHFEITDIESNLPSQLVLKVKSIKNDITLSDPTEQTVSGVLKALYTSFAECGWTSRIPLSKITPDIRQEELKKCVELDKNEIESAGFFVPAYQSLANLLNVPARKDLIWDMTNIYVLSSLHEFSLKDMALPRPGIMQNRNELKLLFASLSHNTWFTTLSVANVRFDRSVFDDIAEVFLTNNIITTLILRDCNLMAPDCHSLGTALSNRRGVLPLSVIDLSDNPFGDKGLSNLTVGVSSLKKLVKFDISRCNLTQKSITEFFKALLNSETLLGSLKQLSFSGNKFDLSGSSELGNMLSKATKLVELNIADCKVDYSNLKPSATLVSLDFSGLKLAPTKDNKHLDFSRFLSLCKLIKKLKLTHATFTSDIFKNIVENIPTIEHLNLAHSTVGDQGIEWLAENASKALPNLVYLDLSSCFDKKPSNHRSTTIQKFARFLGSNTSLQSLTLRGDGAPLRHDVTRLLYALVANHSLHTLDISGHHAGDSLAINLSRLISFNNTLHTLYWDDNDSTLRGLQLFRFGLGNNRGLRSMPLPMSDITSALLREKDKTAIFTILNEIQDLIGQNAKSVHEALVVQTSDDIIKEERTRTSPSTRKAKNHSKNDSKTDIHASKVDDQDEDDKFDVEVLPSLATHQSKRRTQVLPQGIDIDKVSSLFSELNSTLNN